MLHAGMIRAGLVIDVPSCQKRAGLTLLAGGRFGLTPNLDIVAVAASMFQLYGLSLAYVTFMCCWRYRQTMPEVSRSDCVVVGWKTLFRRPTLYPTASTTGRSRFDRRGAPAYRRRLANTRVYFVRA